MTTPPSDPRRYSLAIRKTIVIVLVLPIIVPVTLMILDYKGVIDVEDFGLPESYLSYGGLAVILLAAIPIFLIWRCPGCGAYLGREINPRTCWACGALFQ
jgi:hypothetical protein